MTCLSDGSLLSRMREISIEMKLAATRALPSKINPSVNISQKSIKVDLKWKEIRKKNDQR